MLAKFARPILTNVLPRERLFQLADQLMEKPVIWTSGPAGSGKTTLFASFIESRQLPHLWYQVDRRDSDPASFFHFLNLAVQSIEGFPQKPLPLFSPDYLPSLNLFAIRYFEDLFSRLKHPFIFVLDNYQDVPEDSPVHGMLKDGLSRMPFGTNVIFISRSTPPKSFARMRTHHKIGMIGWSDLKLTLKESQDLLHLSDDVQLSQKMMTQLHSYTDGWAAGLVLVQDSLKTQAIDLDSPAFLPTEEIFDYFASEIFDRTDPREKAFLCQTALLAEMTIPLAADLTGATEAEQILSRMNRMNHFTEKRLATTTIAYQYHPLFRHFLLSRAREMFAPDEFEEAMRNAARLLEKEDRFDDAFGLFSELNDHPNMARLIQTQAFSLVSQGRYQTLGNWLKALPHEAIEAGPWLLYWTGVVLTPFEPVRGQDYFEKAFYLFREQQDHAGTLLAWSGVVDTFLYSTGAYYSLDPWIDMFHDLMEKVSDFPSPQIEARISSSILTALGLRQPDHPRFEEWAQRCLALARDNEDVAVRLQVYLPLAFCRLFQGAYHDVALLIETFGPLAHSEALPPLPRIMQLDLEAYYSWLSGNFKRSRAASAEGLELSEAFKIPVFRFMLRGHAAAANLSENRIPEAETVLSQMAVELKSVRPWDNAYYQILESWAALNRNDLSKAAFCAEQAWERASAGGEAQSRLFCALAQAIVALEMGQPRKCAEYIQKVKTHRLGNFSTFFRFSCRIVEARLAMAQDDMATMEKALAGAFALAKSQGYCNFFLWQSKAMATLCLKALEKGIEPEYTRRLIRKRNLEPPKTGDTPETWPWPIRIRTLGQFEILLHDEPLQFSGKVQKKPLSLLKALIAFGGRNVGEHQVCDALWPESEGDKAYSAFTSTLSRLRNLLKVKGAIEAQGGLISLNPRLCQVDLWSLESDVDRALALWKDGTPAEALVLTDKICNTNHGPFLPNEPDLIWAEIVRTRLRARILRCIDATGRHLEDSGQWEIALHYYAEGLKIAPCEETLYERRMICFQHLGKTGEAQNEYQQCRATLSALLDIDPSEGLQSLFQSMNDTEGHK